MLAATAALAVTAAPVATATVRTATVRTAAQPHPVRERLEDMPALHRVAAVEVRTRACHAQRAIEAPPR